LGINTGFGDVHNLIWKLHAVESGQCDDTFLDTYEIERIPIAIANSRQSHANEAKIHALGRAIFGSGDQTAEERMQDPKSKLDIENAIRENADHFDSLDLQIGYIYGQPRPAKTVRDFTPQYVPGARLPHAWVQCYNKTISTLDLVRGHNFVLFTTPGFVGGKTVQVGMFTLDVIQPGEDFLDRDGEWSRLMGLDNTQAAVLVRPDQHIVARVKSVEEIETTMAEFLRFKPSISQSTDISDSSNGYMQHRSDTCDSSSHLSNNYHDYLPPPGKTA
jgi:2,4-dichlorophenol 6-monooxygenase